LKDLDIVNRRDFYKDILAFFGFILFYTIAYRDIVFQQSRFWALNLIPLPTTNPRYYVPGQLYWYSGNLGSPSQPNIASWFQYFFVTISAGDLVLAEKLLASTTLFSCFTMYFFLSNHFTESRLACFSASLIYGFGPATVLNFADFLHWGYVTIPLVFNYTLNILEERRKIKDILLLGLSLSVTTSFLPQILSLILLSMLIFFLIYTLTDNKKLAYLKRTSFQLILTMLVFVATSPYLITGGSRLLESLRFISPIEKTLTPLPVPLFAYTYSNQEIANTIRLIGGAPSNHLPERNLLGFILPIAAFCSLLLTHRKRRYLILLSLSLISLVIITVIYGIHLQVGWAMWLLNYTPARLFFYPERPLYIVAFAYAVMISATIEWLMQIYANYSLKHHGKILRSLPNSIPKSIFSILLVSLILSCTFSFAPVFDVKIHQERYCPLPQMYSSVQGWLSSLKEEAGMYRVMFLPTDYFSTILGNPDAFEYSSGFATRYTSNYIDFVYNQLVKGHTHNLGSLLAPASVKYIILATPDPNTLWRGTKAMRAPLHPTWDLSGRPRYTSEGVQGDPFELAKILDAQNDLKLIHLGKDFRVYENMAYLPKISAFSGALYVVGSEEALSALPKITNFSINSTLLIFAYQNPDFIKELRNASFQILFFNSDIKNYTSISSLSMEEAMSIIGSRKQLYVFTQDQPTFTRLIAIPSGQWYIAVKMPEPIVVDPSMGIIDLDKAQTFIITRENFKPAHNPPTYDFDLANYYLYTDVGGNFTITVKGSGSLWAHIAYNVTRENIVQKQKSVDLPDSGTFTIKLPPKSSLQPIINAYNPYMNQKIPNNITEIVIKRQADGEYPVLSVDNIAVPSKNSSTDGWIIYEPIHLYSGAHNLTMTNSFQGSLIVIYNVNDMAEIFKYRNVNYEFHKISDTEYIVKLKATGDIFLSLSESYHPCWSAYMNGKKLTHFVAFSYSNGFYVNNSSMGELNIIVTYDPPLLNHIYVVQQILFATLGLFLIASTIHQRMKNVASDVN